MAIKPTTNYEMITPDIAQKMLEKNTINRKLNEHYVAQYAMEMSRGTFIGHVNIIIISRTGDLLDGQHRLAAIVRSKKSVEMLVMRNAPPDAMKVLDTGKNRTAGDVLHIEGVENADGIAAMIRFIIQIQRGQWSDASTRTTRGANAITHTDVSAFASENMDSLNESYAVGFNKENKIFPKSIMSGFHYIIKGYNKNLANEFFEKLIYGNDLSTGSPIRLFRDKLIADLRSRKKMPIKDRLALFIKTWNFFKRNEKVQALIWLHDREPFPKLDLKK